MWRLHWERIRLKSIFPGDRSGLVRLSIHYTSVLAGIYVTPRGFGRNRTAVDSIWLCVGHVPAEEDLQFLVHLLNCVCVVEPAQVGHLEEPHTKHLGAVNLNFGCSCSVPHSAPLTASIWPPSLLSGAAWHRATTQTQEPTVGITAELLEGC
ncbi:hypothetical protein WMY93_024568 [Mugilogobius chulae]|uniref:Uncharacterized protein n=1 Tax=Mugilogobius chulae TaxID=88201 RepID=A0AAW0N1N0_9GOBI